jgi:hypothetical protein
MSDIVDMLLQIFNVYPFIYILLDDIKVML